MWQIASSDWRGGEPRVSLGTKQRSELELRRARAAIKPRNDASVARRPSNKSGFQLRRTYLQVAISCYGSSSNRSVDICSSCGCSMFKGYASVHGFTTSLRWPKRSPLQTGGKCTGCMSRRVHKKKRRVSSFRSEFNCWNISRYARMRALHCTLHNKNIIIALMSCFVSAVLRTSHKAS